MQGAVCGATTKREGNRDETRRLCCRCSGGTDYNRTLICLSTSERSHVAGRAR